MDNNIATFQAWIHGMGNDGYMYSALGITIILFMIHTYSTAREKKKLRHTVNAYIEVFQKAFDLSDDALIILSTSYKVIYMNKTAMTLLGLDKNIIDKVLTPMPKIKRKREWESLSTCISEKVVSKNTTPVRAYPKSILKDRRDKETEINLFIDTVKMTEVSTGEYTVVSMHDLSQANAHAQMEYKHSLTKLPNQLQILQDLPALFSKVHIENNKIALILLDFDNFTRLRSIIGYEQANKVVLKFSQYLNTIVSTFNISVYHTFDNHFLLTVSNLESIEAIENFVKEIQAKLANFYKMEDVNLHLTVSAGIAVYPDSGSTRQLLDNAYKALTKAENDGDGKIEVFLPQKSQSKYDELTLHNDMEGGLARGEFEVYYQPIVKADTHEIVSAEALIRWIHPTYGFIPPDVFIGLMEKTGFIVKLGRFILEEVLKQQKRWELFKFKQIGVSINVSMVEIATGEFVEHVKEKLAYHRVNPEFIKFEITEGMAMIGEGETEKYFHRLKKLGVSILLDDFGTGYTSFTYLKKFPADIIKIDKTLVDYILENEEDQRIVKAMIDLGHNLGMKIVVEGVENKAMVTMLDSYGCDFIQGYYFSKPLPVFEFQKLLR